MNKIVRYFIWELKNEFVASGCFCVMLFCYGGAQLIYGNTSVKITVLIEMFLLNYLICTIQKTILDGDKDYEKKSYYARAFGLTIFSLLLLVLSCRIFGWFDYCSIYAEIFLYICMVSAYLFTWLMMWLDKKRDTKELNEQLLSYKEKYKDVM